MTQQQPLLVVGHGTVDEGGVAEFRSFLERLRARMTRTGVEVSGGFIELSAPAVTEVWSELVEREHRRMVVVPLVLVAAGHGKGDIPAALEREVRRNPGTSYAFGRPLGPHPILLGMLTERIAAEVPREEWSDTAVVLIGRGSTDPDANAEVAKVSRLLEETGGFFTVETSFISLAAPDVPSGLERASRLGAKKIVVAPYFLFDGVLPQRVVEQSREYADSLRKHPSTSDVVVRMAGYLGDCEALVDLVVERYDEALHGDIRMNCDTCAYRVLLPGFEDKLGQAQTPHHHPEDPTGRGHGHGHGHGHAHDHAG